MLCLCRGCFHLHGQNSEQADYLRLPQIDESRYCYQFKTSVLYSVPIRNPDPKNWTVHAGVNLQQEMYSGISQEMEPSDLVIHPSYSTETFENDIALIRLMDHLTMGRMVSPVCLPTSDDEVVAGEKYDALLSIFS